MWSKSNKKQSPVECEIFPLVSFPPSAHLAFFFLLCHLPRPATPTSPTPPQASPAQLSQPQPSPTSPASQAKKLKKLSNLSQPDLSPFLTYLSFSHQAGGQAIRCIVACSAKQHVVTAYPHDAKFPTPPSEAQLLAKKIKGIPRSKHHEVSVKDFIEIALRGKQPKKIQTGRLSRSSYKIFMTRHSKKCLSRLSTKRLFYEKFKRSQSFVSFPLNWKSVLDLCNVTHVP